MVLVPLEHNRFKKFRKTNLNLMVIRRLPSHEDHITFIMLVKSRYCTVSGAKNVSAVMAREVHSGGVRDRQVSPS